MLIQQIPETLMSYQLTHVFNSSLGSVLFVDMRERQIEFILFLRQQFKIYIVNVAVIYKVKNKFTLIYKENELQINSKIKTKPISS